MSSSVAVLVPASVVAMEQPQPQPRPHTDGEQVHDEQQQLATSSTPQKMHNPSPRAMTDDASSSLPDSDYSTLSELSLSDSELSSIGSLSPPPGYLSPVSSQSTHDSNAETSKMKSRKRSHRENDDDGSNSGKDGDGPVRKKRRSPEPKPRTRQFLDLRISQNIAEQTDELSLLLKTLRKRRKIVVVAGAGISVSAGIPDFRSSTGLFKSLKSEHKLKGSGKSLFDASVYQTDKLTSSFHDMVRSMSSLVTSAKPTPFHHMLERLGAEGRLMRLYTQNVDGIDTAMPSLSTSVPLPQKGPWPRAVQLHGGLEKMVCSKCHALSSFEPERFNGPAPPPCDVCLEADRVRTSHAGKRSHGVGRLRPRMVLYNEQNPDDEAIGACVAADLRARPDALIVVGTSMKIPGVRRIVREMCGVVRGRRDGVTIWMNYDEPPTGPQFEDCWDLVIKGPCDEVANQWTLADTPSTSCTSSDVENAKARVGGISVVVPSDAKSKKKQKVLQLETPDATPKQLATKPAGTVPKIKLPKITLRLPPKPENQESEGEKVVKATTAGKQVASIKKAPGASSKVPRTKAAKPTTAKRPVGRPKGKASSKTATPVDPTVGSGGITSHFSISKTAAAAAALSSTVASKKGLDSSTKDPTAPLFPPSDPRATAPPTQKVQFVRPNQLARTPLHIETKTEAFHADGDIASRRSSMETVSPTSVPKGMADLLA